MGPSVDDLRRVMLHGMDLPLIPGTKTRHRPRALLHLCLALAMTLVTLVAAGPVYQAWAGVHAEHMTAEQAISAVQHSGHWTMRRTALAIAQRRLIELVHRVKTLGMSDPGLAADVDQVLREIGKEASR